MEKKCGVREMEILAAALPDQPQHFKPADCSINRICRNNLFLHLPHLKQRLKKAASSALTHIRNLPSAAFAETPRICGNSNKTHMYQQHLQQQPKLVASEAIPQIGSICSAMSHPNIQRLQQHRNVGFFSLKHLL